MSLGCIVSILDRLLLLLGYLQLTSVASGVNSGAAAGEGGQHRIISTHIQRVLLSVSVTYYRLKIAPSATGF